MIRHGNGKFWGGRVVHCKVGTLCHERCKTAERIEMSFGIWFQVGPRKHGVYTGATWWIPLNRPSGAAMQPVVKLHCSLVVIRKRAQRSLTSQHNTTVQLECCHHTRQKDYSLYKFDSVVKKYFQKNHYHRNVCKFKIIGTILNRRQDICPSGHLSPDKCP